MGMVPHSGNSCSGMCASPCDHPDCWQCDEIKDREALPKALKEAKLQFDKAKNEKPKGLLGALPKSTFKDSQTTTITRALLEGLCEKAGIQMDWNNGTPIFKDDGNYVRAAELKEAERRRLMEDKVRKLEDITKQQQAGILSQQAARSLAEAAVQSMDQQVSDILRAGTSDILKADAEKNEARVIAELKAKGATDEDIAAAEELLGGRVVAPNPNGQPPDDWALDPERVQGMLTIEQLKREVEKMKQLGLKDPGVIIHPADYQRLLDAELQSVSGLNDLLAGQAPASVQASGRAISDLIQRKMEETLRAPLPHLSVSYKGMDIT